MSNQGQRASQSWLPLFIAVCLVAVNMRMTISGLGPLLDDIAADEGVSPAVLGLLASLPLLTWAAVSPLAHSLAARIGLDAAVSWSLVLLLAATGWRSFPGTPLNLWLGTALIGAALAITNVLLPASIKRDFGTRIPLVMGVYSALIGVSGALGAAMVAPIAHHAIPDGEPLGWRWALLATGATVPVALLAWVWATRRKSARAESVNGTSALQRSAEEISGEKSDAHSPDARNLGGRVWRDPVAWQIAFYMGSQSWCFYIYATWFAPIEISRGTDPVIAGLGVTLFHSFGILGSLISPLISRGAMRRLLPMLVPTISLIGASGMIFLPGMLPLWLVLCGLASGAGLSIALTFIAQRSSSSSIAGAVSGMAQSIGYLIAAAGPVLFGLLHDLSGAWGLPLIAVFIGASLQFGAGFVLLRERMVFSRG